MTEYIEKIVTNGKKRTVIIGGGFAGLKLASGLSSKYFHIVLLDKNNYHQFQPLYYQVATAGLEPSSISFPFRKVFQNKDHIQFRIAELESIDQVNKEIKTSIGKLTYDILILAMGVNTNFFGNKNLMQFAYPMKSITEALYIRNAILQNYERALGADEDEQKALMNVVVVGGGPTGVELAGAMAEMKQYVLPRDYPELDFEKMQIYLLEGSDQLLNGMSTQSGSAALKYLKELKVQVSLNTHVTDYNGLEVVTSHENKLCTRTLLWAAGVNGKRIAGLADEAYGHGSRLLVDRYNRIEQHEDIYALGDNCMMATDQYPHGHPQVAQVAIQQAKCLAQNLGRIEQGKKAAMFEYRDMGSLATIGRNLAVADLPVGKMKGFLAWLLWLFVHLMSILGARNRLLIFINWAWRYITYDQSLRLLIRPRPPKA